VLFEFASYSSIYLKVGDLNMCLRSLDFSLGLSKEVGDTGRDSDVLGEIADVYTEMGDLDKAGQASSLHCVHCHIALLCSVLLNRLQEMAAIVAFAHRLRTISCTNLDFLEAAKLSQGLHAGLLPGEASKF